MGLSIGQFSELTGLSIHTLRYYEKEKLIQPERQENGRRVYCEGDQVWMDFIKRLKETGMPIREITQYAKLRAEGDTTLQERMEMLTAHQFKLRQEIERLQEHLTSLDGKIEYYKGAIKAKSQANLE